MDVKARKILLKAKKQVFSGMLGDHSSLFKGQGFDFMELREYQDGDDVKHIDWIVTAKKHKPFVKIFHEQRQLNITLLPLLSGSLHFGTAKLKYEILAQVYALLGLVTLKNKDICQSLIHKKEKKIKKITHIHEIEKDIEYLLHYPYLGKEVELANVRSLKIKKSLMFMIGDFVGDFDISWLSKKHDLVAIIIRDRFEKDPQDLGVINAIDTNSNNKAQINFDESFCSSYKKAMKQNDEKLYAHFRRHRVRYIKIYTDEDPYKKMLSL